MASYSMPSKYQANEWLISLQILDCQEHWKVSINKQLSALYSKSFYYRNVGNRSIWWGLCSKIFPNPLSTARQYSCSHNKSSKNATRLAHYYFTHNHHKDKLQLAARINYVSNRHRLSLHYRNSSLTQKKKRKINIS